MRDFFPRARGRVPRPAWPAAPRPSTDTGPSANAQLERRSCGTRSQAGMALRMLCREAPALRAAASRLASTSQRCSPPAPTWVVLQKAAYAAVPIIPPELQLKPQTHPIDTHLLVKELQKAGMVSSAYAASPLCFSRTQPRPVQRQQPAALPLSPASLPVA